MPPSKYHIHLTLCRPGRPLSLEEPAPCHQVSFRFTLHAPQTSWTKVYITLHRTGRPVPPEGPAPCHQVSLVFNLGYTDLMDQYRQKDLLLATKYVSCSSYATQTWWTSTAGRTCSLQPSKSHVQLTLHRPIGPVPPEGPAPCHQASVRFILRSTDLVIIGLYYAPYGHRFILRSTDLVVTGLYYALETWWLLVYITLYRPGGHRFIFRTTDLAVVGLYYYDGHRFILRSTHLVFLGLYYATQTWWISTAGRTCCF